MSWKKYEQLASYPWEILAGKVAPEVLSAPKTGGGLHGEWLPVHERIVRYLLRHVVGQPWKDHLTLIAAVLSARNRDVSTVELIVQSLQVRFSRLLPALGLGTMDEWNADLHIPKYLKGEVLPEESSYVRFSFLRYYTSATKQVWYWFNTLPEAEQHIYRPFILPVVNPFTTEGLDRRKEVQQQQQQTRKTETEAVVPQFTTLRAEAHFRFNRLFHLRQAYQQALAQVHSDHSNLPLDFHYEEGDPPAERLYFRLWDRTSFVLAPERANRYSRTVRNQAKRGVFAYEQDRNGIFLEFVKAERIIDGAPAEGLWFTDLLKLHLLSNCPSRGEQTVVAERQAWLQQWGYREEHTGTPTSPFRSNVAGILRWKGNRDATFLSDAQDHTDGVIIPIEPLYVAATFGLLSLDLLTTTGMRANELLQLNLSSNCIVQLVDDPPPGAKDHSPRIRYLLRLLPKGERTETRHNYGIGKESVHLIEKTAHMLCEQYQLQPGETLPRVPFDPAHQRSHRFPSAPYLFQYTGKHLDDHTITACMRFLLHGLVFQTSTGKPVVLKAHLLRHAFATFAVQIEGVPIDLVAEWLKQKNVETTHYYSKKTPQMIAEEQASFLARLSTKIHVREAILRSPEEIQKYAEEARKRIGMLVPVAGGECMLDAYCPNQFDCIHCPMKAPEPEKRYQVEEKQCWAKERLVYYEQEGLILEAEKMKQLLRACELELREIDQIIAYRKDERRVIQIQPRPKRPS